MNGGKRIRNILGARRQWGLDLPYGPPGSDEPEPIRSRPKPNRK